MDPPDAIKGDEGLKAKLRHQLVHKRLPARSWWLTMAVAMANEAQEALCVRSGGVVTEEKQGRDEQRSVTVVGGDGILPRSVQYGQGVLGCA